MNDDIELRVRRIYAAIDSLSEEWRPGALRVKRFVSPKSYGIWVDFNGGTSDEELANSVHTAIHNIANLRDHLRKWARRSKADVDIVNAAFDGSEALLIMMDLSNNDKHGYPPRDGGLSGRAPYVGRVFRAMVLGGAGSSASFMVSLKDFSISGHGHRSLVTEAEVFDKDDKRIDDLAKLMDAAVAVWEDVLIQLGA
jgi:hypothetical protein